MNPRKEAAYRMLSLIAAVIFVLPCVFLVFPTFDMHLDGLWQMDSLMEFICAYKNTVILAIAGVLIQIVIALSAGYAIARVSSFKVQMFFISYEKKEVLNSYNYSFHCGRIYGIVGKNGSGKTTVLNAMINIFSGEHMGEIFYNGISLNDLDMPQIRRQKVSYVEQHPTMFNISVQNYLHFGVDDGELVGYNQSILLKMFELEYLLDKEINENGSNLSGGEKQKLSIVRSLSKDSSLILLDEPTSALDQKSITTLIEYLELRKQQAIIVIVSHDSRILSSCDELVEMR